MFDVLRKEGVEYVTQADLKQLLNGILLSHPGLEFLQETPEFQERWGAHRSSFQAPSLAPLMVPGETGRALNMTGGCIWLVGWFGGQTRQV